MELRDFESRVLPVKNKLYRLAYLLLQDKEEAEDILQDVFLKLWENKHKLHAYRSIEAFAMCITKNMCFNKLKIERRAQFVDNWHVDIRNRETDPDDRMEQINDLRTVQRLLQNLPVQQKLVLQLRDVEALSFDEIEQVTGLSLNNIRVLLSRARKNIRDQFLKLNNYGVE
ncbi:MAG TPA: RNA polymerase sigma factor [Flavitalea sp.]|nr:RNA polymerase sigma factor [Flavitalea sp.]